MGETIIIRYGEIALKGKNRVLFEQKLVDNIKKALERNNLKAAVKRIHGRMFVSASESTKEVIDKAVKVLTKVFGIVSVSPSISVEVDLEKIKKSILEAIKGKEFDTFRISAQRLQKKLKPSPELEKELGAMVVEKTGKKVKLKNPDLNISLEIADKAYVFTERIQCFGGLPVGIEGKVIALIDSSDESLLAAFLAMKRGCEIIPIGLEKTDISLLNKHGCYNGLMVIDEIKKIDEIAEKENCRAVFTGQTLENIDDLGTKTAVLRPLVGFSNEEIRNLIENAGKN